MRSLLLTLMVPALLLAPVPSLAGAYFSRQQALELAFPEADRVETINLYLTDDQRRDAARLAGAPLDASIYTFYVGKKDGRVTGYAAIEAATVRTLPETLMVVLGPEGTLRFVEVLAFFEPEEYKPSRRWLDQFRGRGLAPGLRVGGDIQGITGATLSAQAVVRQVRRSAALLPFLREN